MNTMLFLVIRYRPGFEVPEIEGVFDTRERAEAVCEDENCGVHPIELNKPFPRERRIDGGWEGVYWPKSSYANTPESADAAWRAAQKQS